MICGIFYGAKGIKGHEELIGLDGLVHKLPGIINKDYNFCTLSEKTANIIVTQVSNCGTKHKI